MCMCTSAYARTCVCMCGECVYVEKEGVVLVELRVPGELLDVDR